MNILRKFNRAPSVAALRITLGIVAGGLAACGRPNEHVASGQPVDTEFIISCHLSMTATEIQAVERLSIRGCADIDFQPLWDAQRLHTLRIYDPALDDISMVAPLRSLEVLRFEDSRVVDLAPLGPIGNLKVLHVVDTPLANIEPLARLGNLEELDIGDSYVTDLTPLSGHAYLHTLKAPRARIDDLSVLNTLPALTTVDLSENGITDLAILLAHPNLAALALNLRGNCIAVDDPAVQQLTKKLMESGARLHLGTQLPADECSAGYFESD